MDFQTFSQKMSKHYSFSVQYKDESWLMKTLSMILFFTPNFMSKYITTINSIVYFPRQMLNGNNNNIEMLAHELKHIDQAKKYGFPVFAFLYLFPQSIAIFAILGFLGFFWVWGFVFFAALLALIPFSSYYRMLFELQAYTVSLYCINQQNLDIEEGARRSYLISKATFMNEQFTGSTYYFMWKSGVLETLKKNIETILDGSIEKTDPFFAKIKDAMTD